MCILFQTFFFQKVFLLKVLHVKTDSLCQFSSSMVYFAQVFLLQKIQKLSKKENGQKKTLFIIILNSPSTTISTTTSSAPHNNNKTKFSSSFSLCSNNNNNNSCKLIVNNSFFQHLCSKFSAIPSC